MLSVFAWHCVAAWIVLMCVCKCECACMHVCVCVCVFYQYYVNSRLITCMVIVFLLQHSEVVHKTFEMLKEKIASYVPEPTPTPEAIDSPLLSVPVPTPMPLSSWVSSGSIALHVPQPSLALLWQLSQSVLRSWAFLSPHPRCHGCFQEQLHFMCQRQLLYLISYCRN